jgi:hypothetical protein
MNVSHRLQFVAATTVALGLVAVPIASWADDDAQAQRPSGCGSGQVGERFGRTELFFGLSRADGPPVTDEEFDTFVDTVVTPRFPDGLTLLEADGQFKDSSGTIIEEDSRLLILLYGRGDRSSSREIEEIRSAYKGAFQQESVLRADEVACVSF